MDPTTSRAKGRMMRRSARLALGATTALTLVSCGTRVDRTAAVPQRIEQVPAAVSGSTDPGNVSVPGGVSTAGAVDTSTPKPQATATAIAGGGSTTTTRLISQGDRPAPGSVALPRIAGQPAQPGTNADRPSAPGAATPGVPQPSTPKSPIVIASVGPY